MPRCGLFRRVASYGFFLIICSFFCRVFYSSLLSFASAAGAETCVDADLHTAHVAAASAFAGHSAGNLIQLILTEASDRFAAQGRFPFDFHPVFLLFIVVFSVFCILRSGIDDRLTVFSFFVYHQSSLLKLHTGHSSQLRSIGLSHAGQSSCSRLPDPPLIRDKCSSDSFLLAIPPCIVFTLISFMLTSCIGSLGSVFPSSVWFKRYSRIWDNDAHRKKNVPRNFCIHSVREAALPPGHGLFHRKYYPAVPH